MLAKETTMSVFTVHDAKTNLSKLIERAEAGEEVIIARGDKPVVRLVPLFLPKPRRPGQSGRIAIPSDDFFFAPLPEEELKRWEGATE
jgi:prevent-host-death family protein